MIITCCPYCDTQFNGFARCDCNAQHLFRDWTSIHQARDRAALQAEVERLKQLDSSAPMTATEVRVRNEIGGAVIKAQNERDRWRVIAGRLAYCLQRALNGQRCNDVDETLFAFRELEEKS